MAYQVGDDSAFHAIPIDISACPYLIMWWRECRSRWDGAYIHAAWHGEKYVGLAFIL